MARFLVQQLTPDSSLARYANLLGLLIQGYVLYVYMWHSHPWSAPKGAADGVTSETGWKVFYGVRVRACATVTTAYHQQYIKFTFFIIHTYISPQQLIWTQYGYTTGG